MAFPRSANCCNFSGGGSLRVLLNAAAESSSSPQSTYPGRFAAVLQFCLLPLGQDTAQSWSVLLLRTASSYLKVLWPGALNLNGSELIDIPSVPISRVPSILLASLRLSRVTLCFLLGIFLS